MLTLEKSKPGDPLLLHDEPIYFDNQIVGRTTSGNFSFCYNKNIAFGYVETKKLEELGEKKNIHWSRKSKIYCYNYLKAIKHKEN